MAFFWTDPWTEMRRMNRDIQRIFDNTLLLEDQGGSQGTSSSSSSDDGSRQLSTNTNRKTWRPLTDVSETDENVLVKMDLPGIPKENISIEVENNTLRVSGERTQEKKDDSEKFHRVERSYSKFHQQLPLPEGVDPASVKASFEDGVLHLTIPKPPQKKNTVHKITF